MIKPFACLFLLFILPVEATFAQQGWYELGTGANALKSTVGIASIAPDRSGNVYVESMIFDNDHAGIAKWGGLSWGPVGTGNDTLNVHTVGGGEPLCIVTDTNGNVFTGGAFLDTNGKNYVAEWDGSNWTEVGTGANALNANGQIGCIAFDSQQNMYVAGDFMDTGMHKYVARWDGTSWTELGTGINALNANASIAAVAVDHAGNVYAAGAFTDSPSFTSGHVYVARWNGANWAELGAGANALNANNNNINAIAVDQLNNVYAAGNFTDTNGMYYVAKWGGTSWTELGAGPNALNANGTITSIAIDAANNLYAGGAFTDANGKEYVAKWDGTAWTELGAGANALNANNLMIYVTTDNKGYVYAAGLFTDANGYKYVARYGPPPLAVNSEQRIVNNVMVYPNPASSVVYIETSPDLSKGEVTVSILSIEGKVLMREAGAKSIDISELPTGIYLLQVYNTQGLLLKNDKLLKE